MSMRRSLLMAAFLAGPGVAGVIGALSGVAPPVWAAAPPKPAISDEASAAVLSEKTARAEEALLRPRLAGARRPHHCVEHVIGLIGQ